MSKETETEETGGATDTATEAKISNFAAKIGQETNNNYQVYVYRLVKDEETGKQKRPFVKKYTGAEPDPGEIAEKFRGGDYLITFIWYVKGKQSSRSFTLEVDAAAFPPIVKNEETSLIPAGSSGLSESMQLQLATIRGITEAMKAAYSSGNNIGGKQTQGGDPLEMFGGMLEVMQTGFSRAMMIQNKIMERVFTRNMEKEYGLDPENALQAPATEETDSGIIGKYAPVVKEIVDGLKYVVGLFGGSPQKWPGQVVDKVRKDEKFKAILKDPKALVVIGAALRNEFGMEKASEYMKTFGVRMEIRQAKTSRTPEIPGACGPAVTRPPALPVPAKVTTAKKNEGKKKEG